MVIPKKWLAHNALHDKKLKYLLNIIFGLFFLFPIFGFILFAIKYDILEDSHLPLFFLGILCFSFFGFTLLRKLFDEIHAISDRMSNGFMANISDKPVPTDANELHHITQTFTIIENQFKETFSKLERKASDISVLKELSELCYVTFDPEEILYVTLERALTLAHADAGSILMVDKSRPADEKSFIVSASIGLGDKVKIGDRIDFETSIAKYAVINKSPLLVEDIEKETRFGRTNRPHYGSKSFACMPIKTSQDIAGVLSVSRKNSLEPFVREDIESLTPLISNAAFTYENLHLAKENERGKKYLQSLKRIFAIINSSLRDKELISAILSEIQLAVSFKLAAVILRDEHQPDKLFLADLFADALTGHVEGKLYSYKGSIFDKVLQQDASMIIADTATLLHPAEKEIIANPAVASCMLLPLKLEGSVKGLWLLCARQAEIFQVARSFLEGIANVISLAMERNRLSTSIMKRNEELDTLRQIGRTLASSTFNLDHVLDYTLEMIRGIVAVEAGSLMLVTGHELEFAVSFDMDVNILKQHRLKIGQGIAGYAASCGKTVIVNDVSQSPHFSPAIDQATGFKTRSSLCVPLISQGKVIAVIQVLNKIDGEFTGSDKEILQSIASSVTVAIENARLYNETVAMAKLEQSTRRVFQKFVPKEILDTILGDTGSEKTVFEEVKTLTLLNIDIRDFSVLTKEIGPQKTVSLLNRFFSIMGGIVFKHHGIVDKYLGDGFLAIFGAPVSRTRDADNALSAALEMKKSIHTVNEYFEKELGTSIRMGISVHTGEVVVGNIGFEMKMDYTVIGEAVNTVFRLQDLTKSIPNGILISEKVRRASRFPLNVNAMEFSPGMDEVFRNLKIYELIDQQQDPAEKTSPGEPMTSNRLADPAQAVDQHEAES
ncbi:MAG: GAF domain-containing protein [Desulfobacterales bacterium]|nr:GAF domain-containing protein [Desulfobacterales bacterium]